MSRRTQEEEISRGRSFLQIMWLLEKKEEEKEISFFLKCFSLSVSFSPRVKMRKILTGTNHEKRGGYMLFHMSSIRLIRGSLAGQWSQQPVFHQFRQHEQLIFFLPRIAKRSHHFSRFLCRLKGGPPMAILWMRSNLVRLLHLSLLLL